MPVISEVPLPWSSPVRVEAPVPPEETARAEASVSTPVEENVEVAVAPKYALLKTESCEDEALMNERSDGKERVTAPVEADAVIWFVVPLIEVTPVLVTLPFK